MTTQTAITPYNKFKAMLSQDDVKDRFNQVLGTKSPGFIASVLNTVYLDDNLRECEPNSILTSALTAAVLDLPIDKNLGFSYIIPYKEKGIPKASFQLGYKGYIQLALRSGQYQIINVTEIYQGEQVKQDRLTGKIVLNGHRNGNAVIGYCAYFKLLNGFEKFHYMTAEEVEEHAKRYSKNFNSEKSIWKINFDAMARKTVLKALISKFGVMSIQMQEAMKKEEQDFLGTDEADLSNVIDARAEEVPQEPAATFDPATVLVENEISRDVFAANGLLESHVPAEIKANQEALVKWGKIYRGWRDAGSKPNEAAAKATAGELPA